MLTLYYHPLSSYCWKALIALYELEIPFTPRLVDFGSEADRAVFFKVWPMGKFPVIEDATGATPESSIAIERLDRMAGGGRLIPDDPELALRVRASDRFYDLHLHSHMQKVTGDRIRPADARDPYGVAQARSQIGMALDVVEAGRGSARWAVGDSFTMADCAAGPALFYVDKVAPFAASHPRTFAYLEALKGRPSFARVLEEAAPYLHMFPQE